MKTKKEISISASESSVRQEYERLAPIYDRRWHNYINKSLSFLVSFADFSPDAAILDLVICANAFHYFASPQLALAEMKRVLKPNGRIIILDWCRDYWVLKICDRLYSIASQSLLRIIDPVYQRYYTQEELEQLLITAGFDVVKDSKVRFGFIWELIALDAILT